MTHYIGQLASIAARSVIGGHRADPRRIAEHMGARWALPAVEKAAVDVNDAALAVDSGTGVQLTAAVEQMRSRSLAVMASTLAPSFPLHAGLLQLDEISPTAAEVAEGEPAAIAAKVPYGVIVLSPAKVSYFTPITLELAASPFAAQVLEQRARDAVSRGLDAALISRVGSTTGGVTAGVDALADVRELPNLISVTGSQPIILGMAPDVAARMATLRQGGVLPFPGAVATGQSEIAGLPAIATDRVAAQSVIALDPSGLAINIQDIQVGASQNAAILMDSAPSMPASLTSAFQVGMIVVRVVAAFGMAVIRAQDVAAELSSIAWANS